ncbi:MAG TPA: hypothetical protein VJR92_12945 [Gemmatimonadaceae bacterium]|nr:hypothetical protein [Gemmatimonadaceae bacterium]
MTQSDDARIRRAFDELRTTGVKHTPRFRAVLDRPARMRRVRRAALSAAAAVIAAVFLFARVALRDEPAAIAEWRAQSDELMHTLTPSLERLSTGSSALNDLLPVTLQIGGVP